MGSALETYSRAVLVSPSAERLARLRQHDGDRFDEVWEGVLHMVPPPSGWHQRFGYDLGALLRPHASSRGLVGLNEAGLYRPGSPGYSDYRQPDIMFASPEHCSDRGVEGRAALVIELLSPGDESREKLPFYEAVGVGEVWLIDPVSRQVEVYTRRGEKFFAVAPDERGAVRSTVLDLSMTPVAGPKLALKWSGGGNEI